VEKDAFEEVKDMREDMTEDVANGTVAISSWFSITSLPSDADVSPFHKAL
jgi:hypothetical protein